MDAPIVVSAGGRRGERSFAPELDHVLARWEAYGVLAAAFRDPDDPEAFADGSAGELALEVLGSALRRLGVGADPAAWATAARARLPGARAAEHRAVFGHVVAHGCPPYETEWGRRHVFGQSQELADIRGFYAAFGVRPRRGGERPDHVACELEFLSLLALKGAVAIARSETDHAQVCREAERRFLADHLARWLPALAAAIGRRDPSAGLAGIAALAAALVEDHARALGVLPVVLDADDLVPVSEEPDGFAFECGISAEAGDMVPPG